MRDVHDRRPVSLREAGEHVGEFVPACRVDHRGRLVGDEQGRSPRQGRRQAQALKLTAGECRRRALREPGQPDHIQQFVDIHRSGTVQPPEDVVDHARAEGGALRPLREERRTAGRAEAHRAGPVDLPLIHGQAGQHERECGLA